MHASPPIESRPPGTVMLELRTSARPENLKRVRSAVRDAAVEAGCSDACAEEVVIAVNEACMNVMEHGYALDPDGVLIVQLSVDKGVLFTWLGDQCAPVDISELKSRDLEDVRPGGLGVHFMRECMDDIRFLPPPSSLGNLLQMTKTIS